MPLTVRKAVINVFQITNQKFQFYVSIILTPLHRKKLCDILQHVFVSFFIQKKKSGGAKPVIMIK